MTGVRGWANFDATPMLIHPFDQPARLRSRGSSCGTISDSSRKALADMVRTVPERPSLARLGSISARDRVAAAAEPRSRQTDWSWTLDLASQEG